MATIDVEVAAFGQPSGFEDRMRRTKFEIPFGHAFDKREVSSSKSVVRSGARPSSISRRGVCGTTSPQSGCRRRSQRFSLRGRPPGTKKEKFSDRRPPRSGIHARLAQNGVWDRDNHARKSRSQCTDPDAAHSRDDRGRDDSAHRDADCPKAIGITLIDAVRDQHHSQP